MRLENVSKEERELLLSIKCPSFDTSPWVAGPPLNQRRVAIVTTAGLHGRHDRPFQMNPDDFYRVIPGNVQANDLIMSHMAASFDRSGFQRDWNVVFPIDRLRELVADGIIGSLADFHYSYNSARAQPDAPEPIREIAGLLKKDGVNAALLFPV
ncbi:MAG: glycine/sarcosine/betaine reductase selenoprotein B family protein [Dehalococcoidales bacterium]|nr:glycine/sarcosine/betaine reductase selenoprotein B family protein [Dehalococcoidales bacterium]